MFDKVWHENVLYKLKSIGISIELCDLLENYLSGRFQRVILNGRHIYTNDSPNELKSNIKLFADDTSLFTIEKDINESTSILNNDLLLISKLTYNWKMFLIQILPKQLKK